ncbi:UDP-N-acetylglucosamine 2-epimerase [Gammaproteobacteria bacterium]|nr:UDP-N-acetylglucosamine 2-epimerase [Gammaproteobacteria bacterium]
MKRKICFITGTRAEYGLLRQLMLKASKDTLINFQLIVTGTHLSRSHGFTCKEIEEDGLPISRKINLRIQGDSSQEIIDGMSRGMKGFSRAFFEQKPDLIVILGDRYEIFSAATAAMIANIPIAHIHGGETSEGAYDEAMRHSITKMSHIHFVAAPEYKRRVNQLGEHASNIFLVGGLGIDAINSIDLMSKEQLEQSLNFQFGRRNLLVTLHPETLEKNKVIKDQVQELLLALEEIQDTKFIFTLPNADTNNSQITKMIKKFQMKHPDSSKIFSSLGQLRYLSTLQFIDGVIGNSSSGLAEVPSFKIGTINLGDRQKGRLKAKSIIDSSFQKEDIVKSVKTLYTKNFQSKLKSVVNPYGKPGASNKILITLKKICLENIIKKKFYDF